MEETTKISFSRAARYRSTYEVRAIEVTQELLGKDRTFSFATPSGEVLEGELGAYIIRHPDGKFEVWKQPALFRAQFEPLATQAAPKRLELEAPAVGEG